jgi:hypothetical protein
MAPIRPTSLGFYNSLNTPTLRPLACMQIDASLLYALRTMRGPSPRGQGRGLPYKPLEEQGPAAHTHLQPGLASSRLR